MLSRLRHTGMALIVLTFFTAFGCGSRTARMAKRKSIYSKAEDLIRIPKKLEKKIWPKGSLVPIEKGTPAPTPGILLSEGRAKELGKLRISYNELYDIAKINNKFMGVVLRTADKSLEEADAEIRRLRKSQNSWWNRNKIVFGVVLGFVLGAAVTGGITYSISQAVKK